MALPEDPVRVLVADDQEHFRHGVRAAIESFGEGIEIIGEAADGDEAVELARREQPDVVLLDVRMPVSDGIHAAEAIHTMLPSCRVLMLTMSDDRDDVANAMRAGADGYLLKDRTVHEVVDAVLAVARGESWPVAAG